MKTNSRSRSWLSLGLCLSLAASALQPLGDSCPAPADPAENRCEHFLVEWDSDTAHPGIGYSGDLNLGEALQKAELGLVELRRRAVNGGWQLEQDVIFPFEDVRLMVVESAGRRNPGLIWREISKGAGRTVFAEWGQQGDQLSVREWSSKGSTRRTLDLNGTLYLPLALQEAVRSSGLQAGPIEVFDPLRGQLATWHLELEDVAGEANNGNLRQAEFYRTDGSLAGRYLFDGTRLVSFRWQLGGLRMRRIAAEEYAQRRVLWGLDSE